MDYETPQVKMIVVEVEQGFAVSDGTGSGDDLDGGWG